jgi:hypothetical protein
MFAARTRDQVCGFSPGFIGRRRGVLTMSDRVTAIVQTKCIERTRESQHAYEISARSQASRTEGRGMGRSLNGPDYNIPNWLTTDTARAMVRPINEIRRASERLKKNKYSLRNSLLQGTGRVAGTAGILHASTEKQDQMRAGYQQSRRTPPPSRCARHLPRFAREESFKSGPSRRRWSWRRGRRSWASARACNARR